VLYVVENATSVCLPPDGLVNIFFRMVKIANSNLANCEVVPWMAAWHTSHLPQEQKTLESRQGIRKT
jgi:hypothetical protein